SDGAIQKGIDNCYEGTITVADNVNGNNAQEISSGSISDTHKYAAIGDALTLPKYYVFFDRNDTPDNPVPNEPAMPAQYVTSGSLKLNDYDAGYYWDTKDSGTGTSYANQAVLTPIRSMILYARSGNITTYSVSFNAGEGGTGTMATVDGIYGKYLLPFNGFTAPAGKQFKAWDVDGVEKAENDVIDVTGDVTVKAVWEDVVSAPAYYTVTFDANGGSGTMEPVQVAAAGGNLVLPKNKFTAPAGMKFKCWSVNGKEWPELAHISVDGNITVTAVWENDDSNPTPGEPGGPGTPSHSHSHIDVWYIAGNSFGTSKSAVPTAVEIDGQPVGFTGDGREFTVSCIPAGARWVTVRWNSTSVTTNFTPDANAYCTEIAIPKTGDASVICYALMAVIAAAGAMGKK
ncbi:MAG: InlB B-repeat-containing protein, partial [Clostridia bacterium]|nr:InlB B-repeat-containing protein [Clostridia bacterium]